MKKNIGDWKAKIIYELIPVDSHEPRRRSVCVLPWSGNPSFELGRNVIPPHQFAYTLQVQEGKNDLNFPEVDVRTPRWSCLGVN